MKPYPSNNSSLSPSNKTAAAAALMLCAASASLYSANLTWAGNAVQNTWRTSAAADTAHWLDNGIDYNLWPSAGNIAVFSGTAMNVIVGTGVSAEGLVISTAGYVFRTNNISLGAGGIDTTSLTGGATQFGVNGVGGGLTLTADQTWKLGAGTTLTANADSAIRVTNGGFTTTLNVATGTSFLGTNIGGTGGLVKTGTGTLTMSSGANSTFTGNVDIQAGTVTIGATAGAANGDRTVFGKTNGGSKIITVGTGATLNGTANNWFGNQTATGLPVIQVNGGNLTTSNYTTIGDLVLNGGAVVSSAAGNANYQGFALRGTVTVGGSSASSISATNAGATSYGYHLATNTGFNIGNATGNSAADLTVSAALRNQGGDFSNQAGGFTKSGAGTMLLSGTSTYTGTTTVSQGTLLVSGALGNTAVSVASGAVFGGSGSLAGATSIAGGGTLLAGMGTATGGFTISSNVSFADGAKIELTLGAGLAHSSLIRSAGTWSFDIDQTFVISGLDFTVGTYENVITGLTGTETGLGSIASWTISGGTVQGNFVYDGAGGVDLVVTAVPEPSTIGLFGLSFLVVLNSLRGGRSVV